MSNPTVTNTKTSFNADANPDIVVRSDTTAGGKEIQIVRLDLGSGATEANVSGSIPINTKTDLTPSAPTFASVGLTSAQAVAANASRKGLTLTNTSSAIISLGFGSAAVLNSGVTLYPMGVFFMGEYDFDLGAVNAIASAAASNLAIQEYV